MAVDGPMTDDFAKDLRVDHIAIAVRSLTDALESFATVWGLEPDRVETIESDGVVEAMLRVGNSHLQLLSATHADSTVGRFLERRGEGLHHICIRVPDIEAAMARVAERGGELIDQKPRIGGGGHRVAFVHPKSSSGVLIELVER
ncbi:MAG TPA: methylmalonyl-CoA epimerase [Actinomycetota bacterium]|nr:methylmalonyl-CoA epimerase [Actinomycetota bacterium]